jgi:hypothetical protein
MKISARSDAKRAKLRGYRIDYISPGLLRGGENEFGMSYQQDGKFLIFVGHESGDERILDVSSIEGSDELVEFFRQHKDLIQERMRSEIATEWKRARIILKT